MLREFSQMWTRLTGQAEAEVLISLNEAKPENAMESRTDLARTWP
jgi:hypothetical protein